MLRTQGVPLVDDSPCIVVVVSSDDMLYRRIAGLFASAPSVSAVSSPSIATADEVIRGTRRVLGEAMAAMVVVASSELGGDAGRRTLRQPNGTEPPPLVLVGPDAGSDQILETIEAGYDGYIAETCSDTAMRLAVLAAAHQFSVVPRHAQRRLGQRIAELRHGDGRRPSPTLTAREKEILAQIASGLSNGAIARSLKLSEGTVKAHVKAILQKTRSANRTQAALHAVRDRIIER